MANSRILRDCRGWFAHTVAYYHPGLSLVSSINLSYTRQSGIEPGQYAVSAFYDKNNNGTV